MSLRIIHIVVCISSFFLLLSSIPLYEYHKGLIQSPIDRHLGYFQFFAITKKSGVNILLQDSLQT